MIWVLGQNRADCDFSSGGGSSLQPVQAQQFAALSLSLKVMPWQPAKPTAALPRVSLRGHWPTHILGLTRCWGPAQERATQQQQQQNLGWWWESGHPCLPILPPIEVPEVLQEGPTGLEGQHQGERPHQLIYPLLSRELLESSEHPLLGHRLVPQDFIHLRGRV